MNFDSDIEEENFVSKTRRKKETAGLQALGEELIPLSIEQLKKMQLPEELLDAIVSIQKMSRLDEARRRQAQYIGRLMRKVDPEPINEALNKIRHQSDAEVAKLHRLERLRDALIEDEKVLHDIMENFQNVDIQHLRSLRRAAIKEKEQSKAPRNFREIFQYLKSLVPHAE